MPFRPMVAKAMDRQSDGYQGSPNVANGIPRVPGHQASDRSSLKPDSCPTRLGAPAP